MRIALVRLPAIILIPCLLLDPAFAQFSNPIHFQDVQKEYADQALNPRERYVDPPNLFRHYVGGRLVYSASGTEASGAPVVEALSILLSEKRYQETVDQAIGLAREITAHS